MPGMPSGGFGSWPARNSLKVPTASPAAVNRAITTWAGVEGTDDTAAEGPEAPLKAPGERPEAPLKAPGERPEAPLKAPGERPEAPLKAPGKGEGATRGAGAL